MVLESLPARPLTAADVKAIAQQAAVENVYGLVTGDATETRHGFDMNIGLNVDGGVDHDYFFDLVIDTGETVTVVAYPRPELPAATDVGPIDDPLEVLRSEDHSWEVIYQTPADEASIAALLAAIIQYRDFSAREEALVDGLAHSGVLDFI